MAEQAIQGLTTRLEKLEQQLNERIPPLGDQINGATARLASVEKEIADHIVGFKTLDQTVSSLVVPKP